MIVPHTLQTTLLWRIDDKIESAEDFMKCERARTCGSGTHAILCARLVRCDVIGCDRDDASTAARAASGQ
jgi:hypothetical protein